jgi:hypothetical protein
MTCIRDGVGVLEYGEFDGAGDTERAGPVQVEAGGAPAVMKEAESFAAKCRRAALGTVGLDVLTARNMMAIKGKTHDEGSTPHTPHPSDLTESERWQENCLKSLDIKGLWVKSS